jgi:2-hydroxychromene-2-carboxylate isomerase
MDPGPPRDDDLLSEARDSLEPVSVAISAGHEEAPMAEPRNVTVYIDYKSPYAYLAKDLAYELQRDFPVRLDWLPYDLDLADFMGSARVDSSGRVIEEQRTPHQWRRVKYSYMDCRRQARKRGLTIRGTQKIWNSQIASIGMLFAKRQAEAVLRRYHDITFERFWKRELDIEDPAVVTGVLAEAGADPAGFAPYLAGDGRAELVHICREAEEKGVFGVPSFIVDGELFWGREHLPDIREMLAARPTAKAS